MARLQDGVPPAAAGDPPGAGRAGAAAGRGQLRRRQRHPGAGAAGRAVAGRGLVRGRRGRPTSGRRRPARSVSTWTAPCWCPTRATQWLEVTAALVDVATVVVVRPARPGHRARRREARRPAPQARRAALVAWGEWPRCEVRLTAPRARLVRGRAGARPPAAPAGWWSRRSAGTAPPRRGALWFPAEDQSCRPRRAASTAVTPPWTSGSPDAGHGRLVPRLAGGRGAGRRGAAHPPAGRGLPAPTWCRPATPRPAPSGVRRGMRRRDAQSRCPELKVYAASAGPRRPRLRAGAGRGRGAAPGGRPAAPGAAGAAGTGAVPRRRAGRRRRCSPSGWSSSGVWDCRFGVADELFTAEQAARRAERAGLPRRRAGGVGAVPARAAGRRARRTSDAVSLLRAARAAHPRRPRRPAGGRRARPVRPRRSPGCTGWSAATAPCRSPPRTPPPDLARHVDFEPPLDNAETISFSVRQTADRVVDRAGPAQRLVCTEVLVEARCEGAVEPASSRIWLHPRWFTAADLVDRLHWQLQGGMMGRAGRRGPGAGRPGALHAADRRPRRRARRRALGRHRRAGRARHRPGAGDARPRGGRACRCSRAAARPADRQALVPWGERPTGLRPTGPPWPGSIPPPAPARVLASPWPAEVVGAGGRPVASTSAAR